MAGRKRNSEVEVLERVGDALPRLAQVWADATYRALYAQMDRARW